MSWTRRNGLRVVLFKGVIERIIFLLTRSLIGDLYLLIIIEYEKTSQNLVKILQGFVSHDIKVKS